MADHSRAEGRIWGPRVVAFYTRRKPLDAEDRSALTEVLEEAISGAVQAGRPVAGWAIAVNTALDAWDAARGMNGPRVAHFDLARGVITELD